MKRASYVRLACLAGLLVLTGAVASALPAQVPPKPRQIVPAVRARTAFDLFSAKGAPFARLLANRVDCNGLWDYGTHCANPYESGTIEGAFWPAGTADNYVFGGGLQVAATVPLDAGFGWAGDTVGVFFFDARGNQRNGETVTGIFDSRSASDLAAWPDAAYARDTSLFNQSLVGRAAVSDQDTWVRYWDGNPALSTLRQHSMGLVVDQRTMAWNRGLHRDIVYLTFRLINVTSRQAASYAGLSAYGYSAADRAALASLGAAFQDSARGRDTTLRLPAGGYTFHNLYVAYSQDPDLGNASYNYSSAVLPFSLVAVMKADYAEPTWQFPLSAFGQPFAAAPGYEAMQLLKTIPDSAGRQPGIAVWSDLVKSTLLWDPVGVPGLYRDLSGRPSVPLGDGVCNSDPILLHTCGAVQAYADTRYFESTGPTNLAPGQSLLIVMAMLYAAPVAAQPATTNGIYAMPAFSLSSYQNRNAVFTYLPGFPATAETLAVVGTGGGTRVCTTACDKTATLREPVERAMGWGQFSDANGDGRIEPGEVQTVPGSLLHKAQAAQALFDHKFLLPLAPEAPGFFLVPGDGRVTVAWQKSATENAGDPYWYVAHNRLNADGTVNPLYDPDFRQFDVQGYRIWRGTSAADLRPIAEFHIAGTVFTDYTGQVVDPGFYGNQCAPELGVTTTCPAFPVAYPFGGSGINGNALIVQVPLGGRVLVGNGAIGVVSADTVAYGRTGTGGFAVPYVFTDSSVRNGFPYVYAVTAFDVNSVRSGPSSLESPLVTKTTTPRVGSGQLAAGALSAPVLLGGDGREVTGTMPTVDSVTGEFTGPMPPSTGVGLGLVGFLPEVVDSGSVTVTVDSILPADGFNGQAGTYYYTVESPAGMVSRSTQLALVLDDVLDSAVYTFAALHASQAKSGRYGADSSFTAWGMLTLRVPGTWQLTNWGRGSANLYPAFNNGLEGPRWWVGTANENTPNPNGGMCSPGTAACGVTTPVPNLAQTAGSLGAAVSVMLIEGYSTAPATPLRQLHALTSYLARAADFKVYWGTAGVVDSVVDVTHRLRVPFSPVLRASWGILTDSSFARSDPALTGDQNNATLTWQDVMCVGPAPALLASGSLAPSQACGGAAQTPAVLLNHALLQPVVFGSGAYGTPAPAATGSGFIFYIAGHFFLMQMAALPSAGTVWSLRTFSGDVVGSPGSFHFVPPGQYGPCYGACPSPLAPPMPGLRVRISFTGSTLTPGVTSVAGLAAVHTVPDPYYYSSAYEAGPTERQLRFINLPSQCVIRIYSVSGILVRLLTHNDATGGGEEPWDLRTREGLLAASGVYFYHIQTPDGHTRVGRFSIVNRGG